MLTDVMIAVILKSMEQVDFIYEVILYAIVMYFKGHRRNLVKGIVKLIVELTNCSGHH